MSETKEIWHITALDHCTTFNRNTGVHRVVFIGILDREDEHYYYLKSLFFLEDDDEEIWHKVLKKSIVDPGKDILKFPLDGKKKAAEK